MWKKIDIFVNWGIEHIRLKHTIGISLLNFLLIDFIAPVVWPDSSFSNFNHRAFSLIFGVVSFYLTPLILLIILRVFKIKTSYLPLLNYSAFVLAVVIIPAFLLDKLVRHNLGDADLASTILALGGYLSLSLLLYGVKTITQARYPSLLFALILFFISLAVLGLLGSFISIYFSLNP